MNKKLLLALSTLGAVSVPLVAVVSCGKEEVKKVVAKAAPKQDKTEGKKEQKPADKPAENTGQGQTNGVPQTTPPAPATVVLPTQVARPTATSVAQEIPMRMHVNAFPIGVRPAEVTHHLSPVGQENMDVTSLVDDLLVEVEAWFAHFAPYKSIIDQDPQLKADFYEAKKTALDDIKTGVLDKSEVSTLVKIQNWMKTAHIAFENLTKRIDAINLTNYNTAIAMYRNIKANALRLFEVKNMSVEDLQAVSTLFKDASDWTTLAEKDVYTTKEIVLLSFIKNAMNDYMTKYGLLNPGQPESVAIPSEELDGNRQPDATPIETTEQKKPALPMEVNIAPPVVMMPNPGAWNIPVAQTVDSDVYKMPAENDDYTSLVNDLMTQVDAWFAHFKSYEAIINQDENLKKDFEDLKKDAYNIGDRSKHEALVKVEKWISTAHLAFSALTTDIDAINFANYNAAMKLNHEIKEIRAKLLNLVNINVEDLKDVAVLNENFLTWTKMSGDANVYTQRQVDYLKEMKASFNIYAIKYNV